MGDKYLEKKSEKDNMKIRYKASDANARFFEFTDSPILRESEHPGQDFFEKQQKEVFDAVNEKNVPDEMGNTDMRDNDPLNQLEHDLKERENAEKMRDREIKFANMEFTAATMKPGLKVLLSRLDIHLPPPDSGDIGRSIEHGKESYKHLKEAEGWQSKVGDLNEQIATDRAVVDSEIAKHNFEAGQYYTDSTKTFDENINAIQNEAKRDVARGHLEEARRLSDGLDKLQEKYGDIGKPDNGAALEEIHREPAKNNEYFKKFEEYEKIKAEKAERRKVEYRKSGIIS